MKLECTVPHRKPVLQAANSYSNLHNNSTNLTLTSGISSSKKNLNIDFHFNTLPATLNEVDSKKQNNDYSHDQKKLSKMNSPNRNNHLTRSFFKTSDIKYKDLKPSDNITIMGSFIKKKPEFKFFKGSFDQNLFKLRISHKEHFSDYNNYTIPYTKDIQFTAMSSPKNMSSPKRSTSEVDFDILKPPSSPEYYNKKLSGQFSVKERLDLDFASLNNVNRKATGYMTLSIDDLIDNIDKREEEVFELEQIDTVQTENIKNIRLKKLIKEGFREYIDKTRTIREDPYYHSFENKINYLYDMHEIPHMMNNLRNKLTKNRKELVINKNNISREINTYLNSTNRALQKSKDAMHAAFDDDITKGNIMALSPEEIQKRKSKEPVHFTQALDKKYIDDCVNFLQYKYDAYGNTMVTEKKIQRVIKEAMKKAPTSPKYDKKLSTIST